MTFKLVVDEEIERYQNLIKKRRDKNMQDEGVLKFLNELKKMGCLEIEKIKD